jgi:CRISPR/Cas system type I-B associated protein Csh2 (Cas7 group RAMP superfamily)
METRIAELEAGVTAIKIDLAVIKAHGATRSDIAELKRSVAVDFADLKGSIAADMAEFKGSIAADMAEFKGSISADMAE